MAIAALTKRSQVQRNTKSKSLSRKVSLICLTDFCCWMPFLICCALHTAEIMDMSPWYQIFSLNILPLNSVINPLLYSDLFTTIRSSIKNHKIFRFATKADPEDAPAVAPEAAPAAAPKDNSEASPEASRDADPEATPETAPEATPEATNESSSETDPEAAPDL
eukprot:sb/3472623/